MKNFDADRRWLKCAMGWERWDRTAPWPTRGPNGKPQKHYEYWVSPWRSGDTRRSMTFQAAMRLARKQSTQATNEKKD